MTSQALQPLARERLAFKRRCLHVFAPADMGGTAPVSSLTNYRDKCRTINKIPDTTERSYYPAVIELLDEHTALSITPHSELSHSAQSKPDLGLYESDIRTLYVEVKLTDVSASQLLGLEQAYRYAELHKPVRRTANRLRWVSCQRKHTAPERRQAVKLKASQRGQPVRVSGFSLRSPAGRSPFLAWSV